MSKQVYRLLIRWLAPSCLGHSQVRIKHLLVCVLFVFEPALVTITRAHTGNPFVLARLSNNGSPSDSETDEIRSILCESSASAFLPWGPAGEVQETRGGHRRPLQTDLDRQTSTRRSFSR